MVARPGRHGGGAMRGCPERRGVDPFAQAYFDKALRLAAGARCIGPCALVVDTPVGERRSEQMAFLCRTVVGHDSLAADTVPLEEDERAHQKG